MGVTGIWVTTHKDVEILYEVLSRRSLCCLFGLSTSCCDGICPFALQFRGVDAGEPNPLSGCRGAGIAVVAGGDHNGCKSSKEHQ